jgi:two-component system, NarL family, sensor kinase
MRHYLELQMVEPAPKSGAPDSVSPVADPKPHLDPIPRQSDTAEAPGANLFDQMLKIHEYERQRLGQELHDSAGQLLVSLQLSVAHLKVLDDDAGHAGLIEEISETVGQIDQEIRTLAFLHYPMELGDRGLASAVQMLVRGFEQRTGIRTRFDSAYDSSALEEDAASALLRVTQEALVNVYRHARASSVRILIRRLGNWLEFSISDDGVGIAPQVLSGPHGIGLQGMRHRVESLGGRFQIKNLKSGTRLTASLPLSD